MHLYPGFTLPGAAIREAGARIFRMPPHAPNSGDRRYLPALLLGLTPLLPWPSAGDDFARVGVHQHLGARELGADGLLDLHAQLMGLAQAELAR